MRIFTLALIALGSSAQASPVQFDLMCTGTEAGLEIGGVYRPSTAIPTQTRLTIDLGRKVWCHSPCRIPGPITVTPSQLALEGGPNGLGPKSGQIDRLTGGFTERTSLPVRGRAEYLVASYACERRVFTGLPARTF